MVLPSDRPPLQGVSHTPEQFFSAEDFPLEIDFHKHALGALLSATHHQEIIYTQVPPAWAETISKYLDEKVEHISARKHYNVVTKTFWIRTMPTEIHDCHQIWVRDEMARWQSVGLLTPDELRHLRVLTGTTISFPYAPYTGSRKEPDLLIRPDNQRLPALVVELGWSESLPRLMDDMNLWLVGGNGPGSSGVLHVKYKRIPIMRWREPIFPAPTLQQAQAQEITLTRRMLFGATIFPGRNPNDVFTLRFDQLRVVARDALSLMNLVPV